MKGEVRVFVYTSFKNIKFGGRVTYICRRTTLPCWFGGLWLYLKGDVTESGGNQDEKKR